MDAVKILAWCIPVIGLVAYQNLSTALVMCAIAGIMIFVVSPKTKELIGVAVSMVGVLVLYLTFSNSYRNERLLFGNIRKLMKRTSDNAGIICNWFWRDFWKRVRTEHAENGIYTRVS